jgi:hypothetical protein
MARQQDSADRRIEWVILVLALALGGCFGLPLHTTDVDKVLPQKAAMIVVGDTDRVAMRQLLGEPLAASEYWRLDLFRLSGTDAAAAFAQWPRPGTGIFSARQRLAKATSLIRKSVAMSRTGLDQTRL